MTDHRKMGHAIVFRANVAVALGSITAAVLWEQLGYLSTPSMAPTTRGFCRCPADKDGWFEAPIDLVAGQCVLGETQLKTARTKLEEAGLLETRRRGLPPKLYWRLNDEALDRLLNVLAATAPTASESEPTNHPNRDSETTPPVAAEPTVSTVLQDSEKTMKPSSEGKAKKPRPEAAAPVAAPAPTPTQASILSGAHDGCSLSLSKPEGAALADACLTAWAARWGMARARVALTHQRRQSWAAWGAEKRLPSDILKAMLGMTHDTSKADRDQHHEWHLVATGFERFVKLYETCEGKVKPRWPTGKAQSSSALHGFTEWEGVWLPRPAPTEADKLLRASGYLFVVDTKEWVDPDGDPRGLIAAHQAVHASLNATVEFQNRVKAGAARDKLLKELSA